MKAMVLVTDWNWFQFLSRQASIDEVNFWQPAGPRPPKGLSVGTPVFFKHHKEQGGGICGVGFFASFSSSEVWLAWEAFGQKNGTPDYASFKRLIGGRLRKLKKTVAPLDGHVIGCIMLAEPVFLAASEWIEGPEDWSDEIVKRKDYELDSGEGKRIWEAFKARLFARERVAEPGIARELGEARYGPGTLVQPRLGQGIFRLAVTGAYRRACAVTREHSVPALEAAHIRPYGEGGSHEVSNGLLLRSDIHRLFDRGYVGVTPDYRFVVSPRLKDDFSNGKSYYPHHGSTIHLPASESEHPSRQWLEWHMDERFLK